MPRRGSPPPLGEAPRALEESVRRRGTRSSVGSVEDAHEPDAPAETRPLHDVADATARVAMHDAIGRGIERRLRDDRVPSNPPPHAVDAEHTEDARRIARKPGGHVAGGAREARERTESSRESRPARLRACAAGNAAVRGRTCASRGGEWWNEWAVETRRTAK